MFNIAVFISGSGTNLQALLDAMEDGRISNGRIALVVSNKSGAPGLARAEKHGIPTAVIPNGDPERQLRELREHNAHGVVLAGYLPILSEKVVVCYPQNIINIHPSLIPSFCGKGFYGIKVHEAALAAGVKITGATVHFVDAGVDTGMIIMQRVVEVDMFDTAESLQQRVLAVEHEILVESVRAWTEGRISITDRKAWIK